MTPGTPNHPANARDKPFRAWPGMALGALCGCILAGGCADHQPDARSRQDALLADPFGYKTDTDPNISGGKVNELDREGLKKDLNNVLNP